MTELEQLTEQLKALPRGQYVELIRGSRHGTPEEG